MTEFTQNTISKHHVGKWPIFFDLSRVQKGKRNNAKRNIEYVCPFNYERPRESQCLFLNKLVEFIIFLLKFSYNLILLKLTSQWLHALLFQQVFVASCINPFRVRLASVRLWFRSLTFNLKLVSFAQPNAHQMTISLI